MNQEASWLEPLQLYTIYQLFNSRRMLNSSLGSPHDHTEVFGLSKFLQCHKPFNWCNRISIVWTCFHGCLMQNHMDFMLLFSINILASFLLVSCHYQHHWSHIPERKLKLVSCECFTSCTWLSHTTKVRSFAFGNISDHALKFNRKHSSQHRTNLSTFWSSLLTVRILSSFPTSDSTVNHVFLYWLSTR